MGTIVKKKILTLLMKPGNQQSGDIATVIARYFPKKHWKIIIKANIPATLITDALVVICEPGGEDIKEEQISKLVAKPKNHVVWIGDYRNNYHTQGIVIKFNMTHLDPVAVFKAAVKPIKQRKPSVLIVTREQATNTEVPYMETVIKAFKKAGWKVKRKAEEIPNIVTDDCMVVIALKKPNHHEQQILRMITLPPYTIWWGDAPKNERVRELVNPLTQMNLIDWDAIIRLLITPKVR